MRRTSRHLATLLLLVALAVTLLPARLSQAAVDDGVSHTDVGGQGRVMNNFAAMSSSLMGRVELSAARDLTLEVTKRHVDVDVTATGEGTVTPDASHTVTLHAATGGTATGGGTYATGETCTASAHAHAGNTFLGWYEGETRVSAEATYAFTVAGDVTLTARFGAIPTFDVTLAVEPAGAGDAIGAGTYDAQDTATITATPAQGYAFLRWEEDGTAVSAEATYTFTVSRARALTARFASITPRPVSSHIVTVHAADGGTATGGGSYAEGKTCTIEASPHEGHAFVGWYDGDVCVSRATTHTFTVTGDVALEARFMTLPTHDVTLSVSPTGSGDAVGAGTYDEGSTATVVATPAAGYRFSRWERDGASVSDRDTYSFTVTSQVRLVAVFERIEVSPAPHTVTVNAGDGGTAKGGGTFAVGETCALSALPHRGYAFAGWYEGGVLVADTETYHFVVTVDVTLEARFRELESRTHIWLDGDDTVLRRTDWVEGETEPTCDEIPMRAADTWFTYEFSHWDAGTTEGTTTTWRPVFSATAAQPTPEARTFDIAATTTPAGAGTITGVGTYDEGSTCIVTATPHEGWRLVRWTEDDDAVSSDSALSFEVTSGRSLVAEFDPVDVTTHRVDVAVVPERAAALSGAGTYVTGSEASVVATPHEGYDFDGWYVGDELVSDASTHTFTVDGDVILTARLTRNDGAVPAGTKAYVVDVRAASVLNRVAGTVTGAGVYDADCPCTVMATAHAGYAFVCWLEDDVEVSTDPAYTFDVTRDVSLEAVFEECLEDDDATRTVCVRATGGGSARGGGTFDTHATCVVSAHPHEGHTFEGWYVDDERVSTNLRYELEATDDVELVARFAVEEVVVHVWLDADGNEIDRAVVRVGEPVPTCKKVPKGAESATHTRVFDTWDEGEADGDTIYHRPLFKKVAKPEVSITYEPKAGGTVTGAGRYAKGCVARLEATPHDQYDFIGWYEGAELVGTAPTHEITVTDDVDLTARFEGTLRHTIVWLDGDGETLHADRLLEGESEPACDKVPTKASDDQYDYTFASWDEGTRAGDVLLYSPIFTATRRPVAYAAVSGGDATWVRARGGDLTLTIKRPENDEETFGRFVGVRLNGKEIPEDSRTVKAGSLVLTLKDSYLQGLDQGSHDLEVAFNDGVVETTITVAEQSNNSGTMGMPEIEPSRRPSTTVSTTPTTTATSTTPTVPTGTSSDGLIRRTPIRSDGSQGTQSTGTGSSGGTTSTTDPSSGSSQTTQDAQRTGTTGGASGSTSSTEATSGTSQTTPTTSWVSTQSQTQTPVRSTLGGSAATDAEATTARDQTPATGDATPGTLSVVALAAATLASAWIMRRRGA